jgi:hypothetical protein
VIASTSGSDAGDERSGAVNECPISHLVLA